MNTNVFLLIIFIITSYIIFLVSFKLLSCKEAFENSEDVMNTLNRVVRDPKIDIGSPEEQYDSDGNKLNNFVKIDTEKAYKDIITADDIVIGEPAKTPTFELLDQIVKEDKNIFRSIQFENNERELLPKPKPDIDFKSLYNSSSIEIPMQERSLNMAQTGYKYNNIIDIEDPISDAYLPYSENNKKYTVKSVEQNNLEYSIISLYKEVLNRNPTSSEIIKNVNQMQNDEIDLEMLRINLLNSVEYTRNVKLQSNEVMADMQYSYAKEDLLQHISRHYYNEIEKEIPRGMLLPLKDIWNYFQGNEYLFRAFLIDDKYPLFERDVLDLKLLTKAGLSSLIDKYYILQNLRLKANDIKRDDVINRRNKGKLEDNINKNYADFNLTDNNFSKMYDKILSDNDKLNIQDKVNFDRIDNTIFLNEQKNKIVDIFSSSFSSV